MVDGQRTPFAGLGVDGKLLNDYVWVKENLGRGMLKPMLSGVGGYLSSVAFKTVPHYLSNSTWVECEVINGQAGEAWRVGPDGAPVGEPIAPGGTLFQGELMMAAAATMPFYGYGLRMFPFAGKRQGMMQLRLGQLQPTHILANLPRLWTGRWFPEGLKDYYAREVHIRFSRPMPFQMGGGRGGLPSGSDAERGARVRGAAGLPRHRRAVTPGPRAGLAASAPCGPSAVPGALCRRRLRPPVQPRPPVAGPRPAPLWGLAAGGARGVSPLLSLLREERVLAMALAGGPTVGDIHPSLIFTYKMDFPFSHGM